MVASKSVIKIVILFKLMGDLICISIFQINAIRIEPSGSELNHRTIPHTTLCIYNQIIVCMSYPNSISTFWNYSDNLAYGL